MSNARRNALQIFHVNVNCSDLHRSIAFYELIGFREVLDLAAAEKTGPRTFGEIGLGPVFRLPDTIDGRAVFLQLGDDKWETRLDLIEWTVPRSEKPPKRTLSHLGVARICLKVKDCADLYEKLHASGYDVYSPPALIDLGGTQEYVFCCEDPDGVVIEFMQPVKS